MKIAYSLYKHGLLPRIRSTFTEDDVLLGPGSTKALVFLFGRLNNTDFLLLWQQMLGKAFTGVSKLIPPDLENALCEFYKLMKAINVINKSK